MVSSGDSVHLRFRREGLGSGRVEGSQNVFSKLRVAASSPCE